MKPIRVLVVDDSVVVRRMLTRVLEADPAIGAVAATPGGRSGLERIPEFKPDVVTLDVEMPDLDGLQVLAAIRKTHRALPVIMYSVLTRRGAEVTVGALLAGASDYAIKPTGATSPDAAAEHVRRELVPKIKTLASRTHSAGPVAPRASVPTNADHLPRVDVLAIGTSTGGPQALTQLFAKMGGGLPVPTVIVQHMPPLFTGYLAEQLTTKTGIVVREARDHDVIQPRGVWIAPGDHHMRVERTAGGVRVRLNRDPPECFCRPSADVLFRSVAETYGSGVLGVVLTGMGNDGFRGSRAIRHARGRVLVQDEASAVVWAMPGAVAQAGLADAALPLPALAEQIVERVWHGRNRPAKPPGHAP